MSNQKPSMVNEKSNTYVAPIGKNEVVNEKIVVIDMGSGKQLSLNIIELIQKLNEPGQI